jgi:hypothetical protein
MVNIISPALTLMCAFAVFKNGLPRMSDIFLFLHVKYYKIYRNEKVLDFYRNILCNSYGIVDRLVG